MVTKHLNEIPGAGKAYDIAYKSAFTKVKSPGWYPRFPFAVVNNEIIREEFYKLTNAELIQVGPKPKEVVPEPFNSIRFKSEAELTMFLLKWS
jgi:hypothetical protein